MSKLPSQKTTTTAEQFGTTVYVHIFITHPILPSKNSWWYHGIISFYPYNSPVKEGSMKANAWPNSLKIFKAEVFICTVFSQGWW